MPKRRRIPGVVVPAFGMVLVLMLACASTGNGNGSPQNPDDPTWQQLLKILTNPKKPYVKWGPLPEVGKEQKVLTLEEQPHGDGIVVYANDAAQKSLEGYDAGNYGQDNLFQMKPGSILVKENYKSASGVDVNAPLDNRKGLLSITVMWKVDGYDWEQGLKLVDPSKSPKNSAGLPVNPTKNLYLTGGDWFWAMFPGCCFQQKTAGSDATCPTAWGQPAACNIETLGSEGFMTTPTRNRHIFPTFAGESVTGKAWFCQGCHNGASGAGKWKDRSYGDYVWKLQFFRPRGH